MSSCLLVFLIVIGGIMYCLIGCFLAGLVGYHTVFDDDIICFVLFWPLLVLVTSIEFILEGLVNLGNRVGEYFDRKIVSKEEKE